MLKKIEETVNFFFKRGSAVYFEMRKVKQNLLVKFIRFVPSVAEKSFTHSTKVFAQTRKKQTRYCAASMYRK